MSEHRALTAGERLEYHGEIYDLPAPGSEGRAIRSLMPPAHLPIYVASLGPANLRLTGELADGWIGTAFLPETADVFLDPIREGAERAGRDLTDLDLTVAVGVEFTDDVEEAGRRHAEGYAFTIGAARPGRTSTTTRSNGRASATASELSSNSGSPETRTPPESESPPLSGSARISIGTDDLVRERLRLYRNAGITTLRANLQGDPDADLDQQLGDLERLLVLVGQVNDETARERS